jgi:hypothetical protein
MAKALQAIVGGVLVVVGGVMGNPALIKFGYAMIVSNVLTVVAQALVGEPKVGLRRSGHSIEYIGTVEPRRIIYGAMKVSGMNVHGAWTSGTNNEMLHQTLAIAGHEVNDITDVYFGDVTIADANIGAITSDSKSGVVGTGKYASKAWIRRYLGTSSQTVDYILTTAFPSIWTSTHRGRGVAYASMQFQYDAEVYAAGKPEPITFMVQGKKVYDPRLDVTPGASPTNASYIAYSVNPALQAADYYTDTVVGLSVPAAKIDWDSVVAAANICDESVDIPGGTQDRYTSNVVLYAAIDDEEARANIETLASAMLGYVVQRGGKYRFHAGAAATPSFALTEDDLVGKLSMRTEIPANDKYNYVRGQYIDPVRNWELAEFSPRGNASYESADGDRYPREAVFQATTNEYEAQRKGMTILKRSRLKRQATLELGMSAFKIRPWDTGTLTLEELGWDEQDVRCMSWNLRPDGVIEATFLEEDSTVWDDHDAADYTTPASVSAPGSADYTPLAPTNFTVTPQADGILFAWEPNTANPPGTKYQVYRHTSATPFASAVAITFPLANTSVFVPSTDTTTRYYWATADYFGTESLPAPLTSGIAGAALSVLTGFRLTVSPSTVPQASSTSAAFSSGSATVTPVSATGAVTYSWVRTSGDTRITVTSSTSATTVFAVTGMAVDEVIEAIFTCTGTDSTAATAQTTVNVSFFRYGL